MRGRAPRDRTLTERQVQVLRLLAEGRADKEIAAQLGITERAVRFHIAGCRVRFGAPTRSAMIAIAFRKNVLG